LNNIESQKKNNNLGKTYKLCSQILIDKVYKEGSEIKNFPFVLKYQSTTLPKGAAAFQIVFVVPKKRFRLATTRNPIRRYMREAIRMNKHELESILINNNQQLALFLLYLGKSEINFIQFEQKINVLLKHLVKEIKHEN